jgi:ribosomal protein S18 acetylase RimI-like enzyme
LFDKLTFRPFEPHDQMAARRLILDGLGEYFDFIDETLNPDVDNIQKHIIEHGGFFLVAHDNHTLIATGGLIPYSPDCMQIVRVSVSPTYRRLGIASEIVRRLVKYAREHGNQRVIVETTKTWDQAVALYHRFGFLDFDSRDDELWMEMYLACG